MLHIYTLAFIYYDSSLLLHTALKDRTNKRVRLSAPYAMDKLYTSVLELLNSSKFIFITVLHKI
jgi:hypothetical protein